MSERLSEEQLQWLLNEACWHGDGCKANGIDPRMWEEREAAYRELLARRAADPTPEQRAWYREQAQLFGGVGAMNLKAAEDYWQTGPNYVRLAAHFGRLAMEGE